MVNLGGVAFQKVSLFGDNGDQQSWTVVDGTQISQGIGLFASDPRTAAKVTAANASAAVAVCGISAMEKKASDGSTTITVYTNGVFTGKASGAITVGSPVVFIQDNFIMAMAAGSGTGSGAIVAGYARETFSDQEIGEFRLRTLL